MKPNTEKPTEPSMQFFPRELYVQLNSPREVDVDAAEAAWEEAVTKYEAYLDSIREELPANVRNLAQLYLHDAEFLAMTVQTQALDIPFECPSCFAGWTAVTALAVEQDGVVRTFVYSLQDRVRESSAPQNWPLSRSRRHWLCDEIFWPNPTRPAFQHRILFSDGIVVEIPFVSVVEVQFSLADAIRERRVEQTALKT